MPTKLKYKVVKGFELNGVLQEVGSVVELTPEQANSGAIGPNIDLLDEEAENADLDAGDSEGGEVPAAEESNEGDEAPADDSTPAEPEGEKVE